MEPREGGNRVTARRKWTRVAFPLLAFLLSLALLEGGGFLLWRFSVPAYEKANVLSLCGVGEAPVQYLPNTFWHHEFNPRHPAYEGLLNSHGTKGEEFLLPKPPGELRVICVGDSTVEGTGVRPNETFPSYLQELLSKNLDRSRYRSVRVINAGVGSHNSAFNLTYLEFRLIHFAPDFVVIKSAYNDYLPYCVPGMRYDYTHVFPNPYHRLRPSAFWSLARYSYFLKVAGTALFRSEVAMPFPDFSGEITREQFQAMDFSANRNRFFVYGENIRSMILLCKGRNIGVALVDLPTSPDPGHFGGNRTFGPRFKTLIAGLEGELVRVAGEEGAALIRTGPFTKDDFWDHCHCTASGNRKVAGAVAAYLESRIQEGKRKGTVSGRP
jgi:lysophospholipase L1-like esterase